MICRHNVTLLLGLFALTQASCVSIQHPLIDPEMAVVDKRLFGQWKLNKKGEEGHVFIGRPAAVDTKNGPPGLMVAHGIGYSADYELRPDPMLLYIFPTRIGAEDFLHVISWRDAKVARIEKWDKVEINGYFLLRYAVSKDRLTLWPMDAAAIKKAVTEGRLQGNVKKNNLFETITVTESSATLGKKLGEAENRSLFSEKAKIVLDRVKW